MTREEIIECIYNDDGGISCPDGFCEMELREEHWSVVCYRCAEKQLAEYEQKIRLEVIDEFMNKALTMIKAEEDTRYGYLDCMDIREIAENMKEQKDENRRYCY